MINLCSELGLRYTLVHRFTLLRHRVIYLHRQLTWKQREPDEKLNAPLVSKAKVERYLLQQESGGLQSSDETRLQYGGWKYVVQTSFLNQRIIIFMFPRTESQFLYFYATHSSGCVRSSLRRQKHVSPALSLGSVLFRGTISTRLCKTASTTLCNQGGIHPVIGGL